MIVLRAADRLNGLEKVRLLALSTADKRGLHTFIARRLQLAMRKAVRAKVEASDLELYEGSTRLRARKARSFARMVGRSARPDAAVLFDRDTRRRGHALGGAKSKDGKATAQQAARLKELGFRVSRAKVRAMPEGVAGKIIRHMEAKQGQGKFRRRDKPGSLLLLVWREQGEDILAEIDVVKVFRDFLRTKIARARGRVA